MILSADTHMSYYMNILNDIEPDSSGIIAHEFGVPGISSPSHYKYTSPGRIAEKEMLLYSNPRNSHLQYVDAKYNGYMVMHITKEESQIEWYYIADVKNAMSEKWEFASFPSIRSGLSKK